MRNGLQILLTLLITITVVFMFAAAFFGPRQIKMDIAEACSQLRSIAYKGLPAAAWVETNCAERAEAPPP
jgi:hypothetical protein